MTQFTSFVAVEEKIVTEGGRPRRVDVPVEMPHGVSYEGVFGEKKEMAGSRRFARTVVANKAFGIAGGVIAQDAAAPMAPPPYRQGRERVEEAQADTRSRSNLSTSEPESEDEKLVQAKIHPDLAVLVAAGGQGKVKIEVWLADATPETLAALKKLGFETVGTPKVAKIVGGRIEIGKVEALARLAGVRYIKLLTLVSKYSNSLNPWAAHVAQGLFFVGGMRPL
jgi:Ca-activated chloride channel family protein